MSIFKCSLALSGLLVFAGASIAELSVETSWQALESTDGSSLTARHEASGVVLGNDLYLLGGRGNRPLERYSATTGRWENLGLMPFEMHHMQPVIIDQSIYVLGALSCCYPQEEIVNEIHVFDIQEGVWDVEGSLPFGRLRGNAGVVAFEDKIYLIGGNTAGHNGGAVSWFDEYDPQTGIWRELPDAPNARDHFSAVVIGDQLIAAAGRRTALPNPASDPVRATDIFDFGSGQWRTGSPIPTPRAGVVSVAYDEYVIVAGGEINTSADALNVVEAYDVEADEWQILPSMMSGRHGSGGGVVGSNFYLFSGAPTIGGASELVSSERLELALVGVPEMVPIQESPSKGGSSSLLLVIGLMCARRLRKYISKYCCTD